MKKVSFHKISFMFMFQEASGELSWDEGDVAAPSYTWSFSEFLKQFSELYSWLNSIQEAVYGKEESVIDRSLRAVSILLSNTLTF
jgi:hypothetical protein